MTIDQTYGQQYCYHVGSCWKGQIPGPAPHLLHPSLHVNEMPQRAIVCRLHREKLRTIWFAGHSTLGLWKTLVNMVVMKMMSRGMFFSPSAQSLIFFLNFILMKILPVPDCIPISAANSIILPLVNLLCSLWEQAWILYSCTVNILFGGTCSESGIMHTLFTFGF